jgi:hypothetical protein
VKKIIQLAAISGLFLAVEAARPDIQPSCEMKVYDGGKIDLKCQNFTQSNLDKLKNKYEFSEGSCKVDTSVQNGFSCSWDRESRGEFFHILHHIFKHDMSSTIKTKSI